MLSMLLINASPVSLTEVYYLINLDDSKAIAKIEWMKEEATIEARWHVRIDYDGYSSAGAFKEFKTCLDHVTEFLTEVLNEPPRKH